MHFIKRHKDPLRFRNPKPLSKKRVSGLSKENVSKFYMSENTLKEYNIQFPWQIFNVDESI